MKRKFEKLKPEAQTHFLFSVLNRIQIMNRIQPDKDDGVQVSKCWSDVDIPEPSTPIPNSPVVHSFGVILDSSKCTPIDDKHKVFKINNKNPMLGIFSSREFTQSEASEALELFNNEATLKLYYCDSEGISYLENQEARDYLHEVKTNYHKTSNSQNKNTFDTFFPLLAGFTYTKFLECVNEPNKDTSNNKQPLNNQSSSNNYFFKPYQTQSALEGLFRVGSFITGPFVLTGASIAIFLQAIMLAFNNSNPDPKADTPSAGLNLFAASILLFLAVLSPLINLANAVLGGVNSLRYMVSEPAGDKAPSP